MVRIASVTLLAASLLGTMSAPVSHDAKMEVAALNIKYTGFGIISTDQFHRGACHDIEYSSSDAVVAINATQFGKSKRGSSICGKYVKVNRAGSDSTHYIYKVVDVCKDCEENSLLFSERALRQFSNQDRVHIDWELIEDVKEDGDDNDHTSKPGSKPESKPDPKPSGHHAGRTYRSRGTWFSDTRGSCGVDFSQDEMIVALNEVQQGEQRGPDSQCLKTIRVSVKGDSSKSVVVQVVDTCPHRYCSYGQLDLSQAAFKKLAPMSKGVLDLEWSFV
ncbi:hypothetical protein BGZ96_010061 [Linnemannia gamsii]|uniref:RlpA-like protein double-psi beta-barrel domain-containing protein n=1 Tax=Linnemannia gamsii TaxID=64522 RepID=A0ABQ7JUX2_9FUNG|nr:hypothetical protein BGZ96_010061 [Linnemannia gamsii]